MAVTSKPSGSSGKMAIVEETTYGTTPASNLKVISFTSEDMKKEVNTLEDDSIDDGEQILDAKKSGVGASGNINSNFKFDNVDEFYEGLMKESFDDMSITVSDAHALSADNTISIASIDLTEKFVEGDFIKPTGFSTNDFNRPVKITAVTADKITLTGITLVDETPAGDVVFKNKSVVNGTTLKSYSIEKSFKDQSGDSAFLAYKGACVNSLTLSMPQEAIITEQWNLMAKDEESPDVSIGTGYTASTASNMLDTANNLIYVLLGDGEIIPASISSLNLENNLRMQKGVGSQYLQGIGKGKQRISGTIELYFSDKTIYNKFKNNTEDSFDIVFQTQDGAKWFVISIPTIKYTEYPINVEGTESDIISAVSFTAIKDSTLGNQIMISKYKE